jgi:hypothetical protein
VTLSNMEASQSPTSPAMHRIPVGGAEPFHWAHGGCWCFPLQHYCEEAQATYMLHNAQDCREAFERQGLDDPTRPWVAVLGYVGTPVDVPSTVMAT